MKKMMKQANTGWNTAGERFNYFTNYCMVLMLALSTGICFNANAIDKYLVKTKAQVYPSLNSSWSLQVNKDSGIVVSDDRRLVNAGRFSIIDGKNGLKLASETQITECNPETRLSANETFLKDKIEAKHELSTNGCLLEWSTRIINKGTDVRWLEIAVELPLIAGQIKKYWDGWDEYNDFPNALGCEGLEQHFPLSTACDNDRGIALGLSPDVMTSFMRSRLSNNVMSFAVRAVIPAGEEFKLRFVLFAFKPVFGHLDAVNIYQETYSRWFRNSADVDQRLFNGGDSLALGRRLSLFPDLSSRKTDYNMVTGGYSSWEWQYACFRRCGDWLARKELWEWPMSADEKKRIADRGGKSSHYTFIDYEKFITSRKKSYQVMDEELNSVLGFYIINWLEGNLLRSLKGEKYVFDYGSMGSKLSWVTGTSDEYHVFPWASVYEKTIKNDFPDLMQDLDLKAIDIDCLGNPSLYRGELDYYLQGWAYDDKGKYISCEVGQAYLCDYLRSLSNSKKQRPAIIGSPGSFMTTFRADAVMCEAKNQPYLRLGLHSRERLSMGDKVNHLHSGAFFANPALNIDWRNLSGDDIRLYYQNYLNASLLGMWQGGYIPSVSYLSGNETLARAMPDMLDVMSRGYCCVPASGGDSRFMRTRYGRGLQSVIVYSYPGAGHVVGKETLFGEYFSGIPMPMAYHGDIVKFASDGKNTVFDLELDQNYSKLITIPLVLKSSGILPALSAESSGEIKADRISWRYIVKPSKNMEAGLAVNAPPGYQISSVKVNGKQAEPGAKITFEPAGTVIEINCTSRYFLAEASKLTAFPFAQAQIILASDADSRTRCAATMLQNFLKYKFNFLTAVTNAASGELPTIVLSLGNQYGINLSADARRMNIEAADSFELQQLCSKLMRLIIIEKKSVNPFAGDLPQAPTRDMLLKIGVNAGNAFPFIETAGRIIPQKISIKNAVRKSDGVLSTVSAPLLGGADTTINGELDEPAWSKAAVLAEFYPMKGGDAVAKTTVKMFFTENSLLLGFDCVEPELNSIPLASVNRDNQAIWSNNDHVEIYLSPGVSPDEKSPFPFYLLIVDISGNIWDAYDKKPVWNGKWEVAKVQKDGHWRAEIKIPLSEFSKGASSDWRFNVARFRMLDRSWSSWAPMQHVLDNPLAFGVLRKVDPNQVNTKNADESSQPLTEVLAGLKKSGKSTVMKSGNIKEVVFYQNDKYYCWMLKPVRVPFTEGNIDSVNIYLNCDTPAKTGRMDIIDGADWRLIVNLKEDFFKVEKYGDIPPLNFKDPSHPFQGKVHGTVIPKYACGMIVDEGNIAIMIEKDYFKQKPITGNDFLYYALVYKNDKVISSGRTD